MRTPNHVWNSNGEEKQRNDGDDGKGGWRKERRQITYFKNTHNEILWFLYLNNMNVYDIHHAL